MSKAWMPSRHVTRMPAMATTDRRSEDRTPQSQFIRVCMVLAAQSSAPRRGSGGRWTGATVTQVPTPPRSEEPLTTTAWRLCGRCNMTGSARYIDARYSLRALAESGSSLPLHSITDVVSREFNDGGGSSGHEDQTRTIIHETIFCVKCDPREKLNDLYSTSTITMYQHQDFENSINSKHAAQDRIYTCFAAPQCPIPIDDC